MNKIVKRLRSSVGETLVESMAAILIFTFGSIILYSFVSSSVDINRQAKELEANYKTQMNLVEQGQGTLSDSSVALTYGNSQNPTDQVPVTVCVGGQEKPLYAYFVKPEQQAQEDGTP